MLRLRQARSVHASYLAIAWLTCIGHISRDCTAPNGGPLNTAGKTCYRCGETGHISRDCTQAEVNGDATATPAAAPVVAPAPTAAVA